MLKVTPRQLEYLAELDGDPSTRVLAAFATRALIFSDAQAADEFLSGVYRIARYYEGACRDGLRFTDNEASLMSSLVMIARAIQVRYPEEPTPAEPVAPAAKVEADSAPLSPAQ